MHYVFIQTIYQIYFFVLCHVFERPNVFIWSELQKSQSSLSAPPNEKAALFAIPNLIFTVSSKYRKSKLTKIRIRSTYAFDTNSGLKFSENVKFE